MQASRLRGVNATRSHPYTKSTPHHTASRMYITSVREQPRLHFAITFSRKVPRKPSPSPHPMKHRLVQAWKQRPSLTVRGHSRRSLTDISPKPWPANSRTHQGFRVMVLCPSLRNKQPVRERTDCPWRYTLTFDQHAQLVDAIVGGVGLSSIPDIRRGKLKLGCSTLTLEATILSGAGKKG